ncbi:MAG TPA: T9SS type A sorting domain-containing protein [Candidatus Kapabacteria bacterium]|nr:T9SS type A sorting domain-containing protein [Candidatus Kapabacteria bacterium]
MKALLITLLLAGTVPASVHAQASDPNVRSDGEPAGHASSNITRDVVCSGGLIAGKGKGQIPLSIQSNIPMSHCDSLLSNGYYYQVAGNMKESYDTLRLFMEQCPFYVGINYNNGVYSWQVFDYVASAVGGWTAGGAGRWPDFLTWLKKVLYLNPDTMWYCDDVDAMVTAVQSDEAAKEAMMQYILQSGKCAGFAADFQAYYNSASHWRHQMWLDSIVTKYDTVQYDGNAYWWVDSMVNKDTLANPYDSTIPTLWQDSLEILLGPQNAAVQPSSPITSQALLNAQILDNPMQDEIDFSFEMGRTALVTMELRDILGRTVPLTYAKYQLEEPGTHEARIPAPNLPPGTYYLRITTDTGDVITLKVVKQ